MNDTIDICRIEGEIALDGKNIYAPDVDVVPLRARVGMVFQKPNPFPKSIYDNVAYGPRIHGLAAKAKGPVSWKGIRQGLKGAEKKGITAAMAKVMFKQLADMGIGQVSASNRGGITYRALGPFPE